MNDTITNIGNIINPNKNQQKLAVIDLCTGKPRFFTYEDLHQQSNSVARGLSKQNILPKDKVAILAENSFEFLACLFGIMRHGSIAVLINKKLTSKQKLKALEESQSKILFSDESIDTDIKTFHIISDFKKFTDWGDFKIYEPTDDDIAMILYTSGSVNDPKGALIKHKNHAWAVHRYRQHDIKTSDRRIVLISAPLYHANGLTTSEGSLSGHATVILLPKFDALESIKAIEKFKVNTLYGIPTMMSLIVQQLDHSNDYDMSSVREVRMASSNVSQKLIDKLRHYFPRIRLSNNYGITEVGPGLFGPHPEGLSVPARSVGYPSPGIEYRIVNGILEIKSPSMIQSYLNNQNSPLTEDGFFITGDLFKVDENGFYFFLGRADDMFKCGGNRVYPTDVEKLLESHDSVNSAFVLALPDDIKGHKPYAFVILEKDKNSTEEELKQYCLDNGPAYQHPRRIWFIDNFPLAGTNKIAKTKLMDLANEFLASGK